MNDKFNEQKDILLSLKHEISLLHQQVDYLLRNEKDLGLLDLDVLMNRTHTIYDRLCSINLGEPIPDDEEEVDDDLIRSIFGVEADEVKEEEAKLDEVKMDEVKTDEVKVDEVKVEEPIEEVTVEEEKPKESIEDIVEELIEEVVEEPKAEEPEPVEPKVEEAKAEDPETDPNDYGFVFRFEPDTETIDFENKKPEDASAVYTSGDEIEMTIPHLEQNDMPSPDETDAPETPEPVEIPNEPVEEEQEIEYEPVIFGNIEEKEDGGFELDTPETLGDKLQQEGDHSLASKLQNKTVSDLRNSIGINDKFLLVNELFGGSMEKYNKSIENLNDLKTLNGALIYMNELRIELQWNSNNEAYKKLLELVHRKYEE